MAQNYLLDTNVLSELMRAQPNPQVLEWFGQRAASQLFVSAITQAEILTGIALLPAGKRRDALAQAAQATFENEFAHRCLPFDGPAATHYALLVAERTRKGRPVTTEDAQIAAIALQNAMRLVTRNSKDFEHIEGLVVINPWTTTSSH